MPPVSAVTRIPRAGSSLEYGVVKFAFLMSAAPVALLLTGASVAAQTTAAAADTTADEQIVVTGSRIPRVRDDTVQPTVTIDAKALDSRGYSTIAQALNESPGFGLADSSLIGNQGNGFGVGQSFVNFYSLGSQRTLTLVNGRRFVGANPATVFSQAGAGTQVDLNTIPTKLVDRIETISIGGAPIYGADAIAGTVNIILKKDFSGLDLDAQSGISQQGDLANHRVRALGGLNFAEGRGNVTVSLEYNHADGLLGSARQAIRDQTQFISPIDPASPFQKVLVSNVRTFLGVPGGNPYFIDRGTLGPTRSITDAAGNLVRFGPDGNLVTFNTGTPTNDPTTFLGGDGLNFADITNLQVDSTRYLANVLVNYQVTDSIHFFGEGWYSKNKATNLVGQPVYNTAFFRQANAGSFDVNGNFIFKVGNPFLTPQAKALIVSNLQANGLPFDDTANFFVGRANTDIASGQAKLDQDLYRFVGGFNGDFNVFGKAFKWEVSGNYGRTTSVSFQPSIVEPNLRRALNVTKNAAGQIVCAPFAPDQTDPTQPPIPRTDPNTPPFDTQYNGTISKTCAPLNLFGQGAPSQAARDYITTLARTDAITSQRDFVANVSGSIAKLPAGDLGVSVGYENRREYSSFRPDAFYTTPFGRSIPILGVSGSYITNEVFGETRIPLISNDMGIRLIDLLEVNAAGRYIKNSVAGNAFTWTAGGRFAPIKDLTIRGNFTHSVRAPAVTELFAANQPAFDGGYDPCDAQNLTSGPNPARRSANCAAAGLPKDFVSLINSVTVPITVIGNRNLRNETANSWSAGAVLAPRIVPGLLVSADYISIDLSNTVASSSAKDVLNACYDSANYPKDPFCALIGRDPAPGDNFGQVLTLAEPYINQGSRVFRAVQVVANYRVALPKDLGILSFGANYQHIIKQYTVVSVASGPTQQRGGIGTSIDRGNLTMTYDKGAISWFNQIEYIGPALFDPTEPAGTRDVPKIHAYAVYNTALQFNVDKRFNFRINVDNVLNRGLPYPGSGNASQNVYYQGLVGRAFLFGVGVKY